VGLPEPALHLVLKQLDRCSLASTAVTCSQLHQDVLAITPSRLLELPKPALLLVLQDLDPRSLASTAVTCSQLSRDVLAVTSKVAVRFSSKGTFESFDRWLQRHHRHDTSLTNLKQCSVISQLNEAPCMDSLPCRQLRELKLEGLRLQLVPAGGSAGMLHDCTGLTSLDLSDCEMHGAGLFKAFNAAIAAMPNLQALRLYKLLREAGKGSTLVCELQFPLQLTHLSLSWEFLGGSEELVANLTQLTVLTRLQHLELDGLPSTGVPGGLPPQLVQLTCLHMQYGQHVQQLQHLSAFTALRELAVNCGTTTAADLTGIPHLLQLTSLNLQSIVLELTPSFVNSWPQRTALQSLTLEGFELLPAVLSGFSQLRTLSIKHLGGLGPSPMTELLDGSVAADTAD
jgi:hypothetical protein